MARAKRTERTEARRRHRAEQAALAELEPGAEGATTSTGPSTATGTPPKRPGIMVAFRGAMRPLDLVGDLKVAPRVLAHWGVLVAMALTVVLAAWFYATYNDAMAAVMAATPAGSIPTQAQLEAVLGINSGPFSIAQMMLVPPPMIGAFLIGFTARRASWLGGLVYGIFVTIIAILMVQTPSGQLLAGLGTTDSLIAQHASLSPVGASLAASGSAWYRRFLDLANPNRRQARQSRRPAKAPQGRGNVRPNAR